MSNFLITSLIASIVLTILVNVIFQMFPGLGTKISKSINKMAEAENDQGSRVRIIFPWKTMLVLSIGLTILLNIMN